MILMGSLWYELLACSGQCFPVLSHLLLTAGF